MFQLFLVTDALTLSFFSYGLSGKSKPLLPSNPNQVTHETLFS